MIFFSGTDANVFIQLFGDKGKTGEYKLDSSSNDFERGQTDEFSVEALDIGIVQRIRIGHDNAGLGSAWFLESVNIEDTLNMKVYEFIVKQWFDSHHGDKQIEREITPETTPGSDIVNYKITLKTMDLRGAGNSLFFFFSFYL